MLELMLGLMQKVTSKKTLLTFIPTLSLLIPLLSEIDILLLILLLSHVKIHFHVAEALLLLCRKRAKRTSDSNADMGILERALLLILLILIVVIIIIIIIIEEIHVDEEEDDVCAECVFFLNKSALVGTRYIYILD